MKNASPTPGHKRARLFSRDPLPGFVFGLDTNRKDLKVAASSSSSCVLPTAANQSAEMDGAGSASAPSSGVAMPRAPHSDSSSVLIQEASLGAEGVLAGLPSVPNAATTAVVGQAGGQGEVLASPGANEARRTGGVAFRLFFQC